MPNDPKIARYSAPPFDTNHGKLTGAVAQFGTNVKLCGLGGHAEQGKPDAEP